jgi:hypothetical protein
MTLTGVGINVVDETSRAQVHVHTSSSATPETCVATTTGRSEKGIFPPNTDGVRPSALAPEQRMGDVNTSRRLDEVILSSAEVHLDRVTPRCSRMTRTLTMDAGTLQTSPDVMRGSNERVWAKPGTTTESCLV